LFARKKSIDNALKELYSEEFKNAVNNVKNPYGDGGASYKVKEIIKNTNLNGILKKTFYDLESNLQ